MEFLIQRSSLLQYLHIVGTALLIGLARNGKLILLGVDADPIPVMGIPLVSKRCSIVGHPSGTARDSQASNSRTSDWS